MIWFIHTLNRGAISSLPPKARSSWFSGFQSALPAQRNSEEASGAFPGTTRNITLGEGGSGSVNLGNRCFTALIPNPLQSANGLLNVRKTIIFIVDEVHFLCGFPNNNIMAFVIITRVITCIFFSSKADFCSP